MKIDVRYLDNLKLEAAFEDYKVMADQPERYKGDGSAPGPFDYFLASSVMCAAYFVKVYCQARDIPTHDIKIWQDNIVDPENRYKQTFKIQISLPESITDKDRKGMIAAMERCSVKRVIQNGVGFIIEESQVKSSKKELIALIESEKQTLIPGKDASLEDTIRKLGQTLEDLGITIEIASWRNPLPYVWSVHVRDADSPMCYTNGKGASKEAALASALGEYLERISCNYFYNDYFLSEEISKLDFVHYKNENWFPIEDDSLPSGILDSYLEEIYNADNELKASHLVDLQSSNHERGICALPFTRMSDKKTVYIPVNILGNLYVSNGMSAGNTKDEARVQALSEIFERAIKNKIISEEIALPDVPKDMIARYPHIQEGLEKLAEKGFSVYVKDASLGGKFPVMNITIMIPETGGAFSSFGAHPSFEVALERCLTELLQGRSFEGLKDLPPPTFSEFAVSEPNNLLEHFIDSSGVISWKFFQDKPDYEFVPWNFQGTTTDEFTYLMSILNSIEKEVYIADYTDLGFNACRIIVPNFSEIYPIEDLVWDNHNKASNIRKKLFNLQALTELEIEELYEDLLEHDNFLTIGELCGLVFDENSAWGKLTVCELQLFCAMAMQELESTKEHIENLLGFNDLYPPRLGFYRAINTLCDLVLRENQDFDQFKIAFLKMYGEETFQAALECFEGESTFWGLSPLTKGSLEMEKHEKLTKSFMKLHRKRSLS